MLELGENVLGRKIPEFNQGVYVFCLPEIDMTLDILYVFCFLNGTVAFSLCFTNFF